MAKLVRKGGRGSGNFGHGGRPGKVGGSSKRNVPAAMKKNGLDRSDFQVAIDRVSTFVANMDSPVLEMIGDLSTAPKREFDLYQKFMDVSSSVQGNLIAMERADVSTKAFKKLVDATANEISTLNDLALNITDIQNHRERVPLVKNFLDHYTGALASLQMIDIGAY